MADTYSFDIGSKIDYQEVDNAINQTNKEVETRYDLKDSESEIDFNRAEHKLNFQAKDDFKLKAVVEIFKQRMIKRGISPKALTGGEIKSSLGGKAKQEFKIQQGIPKENSKEIVKDIKDTGVKVQTQIQDDQIRVTSKKIDDLQAVMAVLKEKDYGFHAQFLNLR